MRALRTAGLALLLAAAACTAGNGSSCQVQDNCATNICCVLCSGGPCNGSETGICCSGTCDSDGGCPAGSSCDADNICL
jgi:hypothetical protein